MKKVLFQLPPPLQFIVTTHWLLLLAYILFKVKSLRHVRLFVTPWTATGFLCPWDFPSKSTAVGCHFLLQGIFLTRG